MFTGIIEHTGTVEHIEKDQNNLNLTIKSNISSQLKIDQSLAHDGVCLTVTNLHKDTHTVTAINETLTKTTINQWKVGKLINLERALLVGSRLDGHMVQGHVDTTAICISKTDKEGSFIFSFEFSKEYAPLLIEKGSICINGVSLTTFDVSHSSFSVAIIPYTFQNTNFKSLLPNQLVNIEFDILGKYALRQQEIFNQYTNV